MTLAKFLPFAAVTALLFTACSGADKEAANENVSKKTVESLPLVKVKTVSATDVAQIADYTATVEPYKTNNITTSTPNRIKSILVDVGDRVHAGQTVVILDDVNIEQMRLRLENQKTEYDRAVELYNIGGGTKQAVDQLRTEYEAYKRSYENMVENTRLLSPINGVVTARNYDNGDMTSQLPILTIEQIQPVKVIINVTETDFTKVRLGMPVDVKLDVYGDELFAGKISRIYPTIDAATRTFKVEIDIPNNDSRVRPGMFARVSINFGEEHHVVVPDRAIVKQTGSGNRFVYVLNPADSTVSFTFVELGQRLDAEYELISGVNDDDIIVVSGQNSLADGVKVSVIE